MKVATEHALIEALRFASRAATITARQPTTPDLCTYNTSSPPLQVACIRKTIPLVCLPLESQ